MIIEIIVGIAALKLLMICYDSEQEKETNELEYVARVPFTN